MGTFPAALIPNHVCSYTGLQWKKQNNSSEAQSTGRMGIIYILELRARNLRAERRLDGCPVQPPWLTMWHLACIPLAIGSALLDLLLLTHPVPPASRLSESSPFNSVKFNKLVLSISSGPGTVLSTGNAVVNSQDVPNATILLPPPLCSYANI